jgi:hypothetical protein
MFQMITTTHVSNKTTIEMIVKAETRSCKLKISFKIVKTSNAVGISGIKCDNNDFLACLFVPSSPEAK